MPNLTVDEDTADTIVSGNTSVNCTFNIYQRSPEYTYYFCIAAFICTATIIGNALILDAYIRKPSARGSSYHPIILLAISDLCMGLVQPVMLVLYYVRKSIGDVEYIQLMNYCVFFMSVGASVLSLLCLTVDRLIGTAFPLQYRSSLNTRRRVIMTLGVFVPSVTGGLVVPLIWHNTYDPSVCYVDWDMLQILDYRYLGYLVLPLFFLCSAAILAMYTGIFVIARRHLALSRARSLEGAGSRSSEAAAARIRQSEGKLLKTSLLILGTFYICWLPLIACLCLQVYGPAKYTYSTLVIALRSFSTLPPSLNSALNPVIYAYRIPLFREHVRGVFSCCRVRAREEKSDPGTFSSEITADTNTVTSTVM